MHSALQALTDNAVTTTPGVAWSICIRDERGRELGSHDPDTALSTASIGKLLLLTEVARQHEAGSLLSTELLCRTADVAVGDSGLWQYLQVETLPVEDLAVLVASTSDNLATNVLLKRVGLPQVQALGKLLGLAKTALLDRVRDQRETEHPPALSVGSAGELSHLMSQVSEKSAISPAVSERLNRWLATGVDVSMVLAPFGFDPLAHMTRDRGFLARNKTGNDIGVRADVGFLSGLRASVSYAVIANWKNSNQDPRDVVLTAMRNIGEGLKEYLAP
jgi:beta-lactamase class A